MSTNFNAFTTQQPINSPTVQNLQAGQVFDGRGHDFLSPKSILTNTDDFSKSAKATSTPNPVDQLISPNVLGKNPSSLDILKTTDSSIDNILSNDFGANLFTSQGLGGLDLSGLNLANFNPLDWVNPSSSNIMLGTMDAQNKIFGGSGLIDASTDPTGLFPFVHAGSITASLDLGGFNVLSQVSAPSATGVTNTPSSALSTLTLPFWTGNLLNSISPTLTPTSVITPTSTDNTSPTTNSESGNVNSTPTSANPYTLY